MKQLIFLAFLSGFFCQNSFAQNRDSVDVLLEKYGHQTKEKSNKEKKKSDAEKKDYKNIFLMLDIAQFLDNYPSILVSVEYSIGRKFKLFHELGRVLRRNFIIRIMITMGF